MNTTRTPDHEFVRSVTDGALVRYRPSKDKPGFYRHVCQQDTYVLVTHAIEELAEGGFTLEEVARHIGRPFTQVAVAIAFLKERGCIETVRRRNFPASAFAHEDGMVELHALAAGRD